MQHLTYIGQHDEVEIETEPGVWTEVRRGDSVQVSAEVAGQAPTDAVGDPDSDDYAPATLGHGLLAQPSNWAKPTTKAAKSAPTPPAPPEPEPVTLDGQPITEES